MFKAVELVWIWELAWRLKMTGQIIVYHVAAYSYPPSLAARG